MRSTRASNGFTLVEVMVAVVVLAIGVTSAMRAISAVTLASAQAKNVVTATTLAEQVLNETVYAQQQVTDGTQSGDFGPAYPGFRWTSDTEDSPSIDGVQQISVLVEWPSSSSIERLTLTTLYLTPLSTTTGTGATTGTGSTGGGTTGGSGG